MKVFTLILFSLFLNSTSTSFSNLNNEVTTNGLTYLYGEINREGLTSKQYKAWFEKGYNRYKPHSEKLSQIDKTVMDGVTVKLLMATWCGDSKRNVPVFYKIMDTMGFEENKLQVWALDRQKSGPNNEQLRFGVTRVPTIIFFRDDVEIGRFVERLKPGQTLEDIITSILTSV